LYGLEAISAQNGWAMAVAGALIVISGLTVLSLVISQLHKIAAFLEKGVEKLSEKTSGKAVVVTDVGQHQMWSAQFIKCGPRRWSSSAGLGTMGYGLPAAIGAQVAFPNEYVICITGDSSFQMCLQELGTVAQCKLPIRIVIINNHFQGMVRQWQESFYGDRYSHSNMEKGQPNFIALANSYGIKGVTIENEVELKNTLNEYKNYSSPLLLNCLVVDKENCYPMVSPGTSNAAMSGIKYQQDEIELLKRHSDENDDIDAFLSRVVEE